VFVIAVNEQNPLMQAVGARTSADEKIESLKVSTPDVKGDDKVDGRGEDEAEEEETKGTMQDAEDFDVEGTVATGIYKAGPIGKNKQVKENEPVEEESTVSDTVKHWLLLYMNLDEPYRPIS